jgi:hypothetical protein
VLVITQQIKAEAVGDDKVNVSNSTQAVQSTTRMKTAAGVVRSRRFRHCQHALPPPKPSRGAQLWRTTRLHLALKPRLCNQRTISWRRQSTRDFQHLNVDLESSRQPAIESQHRH